MHLQSGGFKQIEWKNVRATLFSLVRDDVYHMEVALTPNQHMDIERRADYLLELISYLMQSATGKFSTDTETNAFIQEHGTLPALVEATGNGLLAIKQRAEDAYHDELMGAKQSYPESQMVKKLQQFTSRHVILDRHIQLLDDILAPPLSNFEGALAKRQADNARSRPTKV